MTLEPLAIEPASRAAMVVGNAVPQGDAYEVSLEVFSGPLGVLLQLIESRQLDVRTVPLADLADGYVDYLASHAVDPAQLAEFVAVAARLILLKSRSLLPGEPPSSAEEPAAEADEEELRRRLIEYRALRDGAIALGRRDLTAPMHRREPRESDLPPAPVVPLPPLLLAAALRALQATPDPEPPAPEIVAREVTIAMQIAMLRAALATGGRVVLQELLAACRSRTEVTVTLLAALELVRRRQLVARQRDLFGPIELEALT